MREVGVEELLATTDDPFLRHHPLRARRAWRSGAATVLDGVGGRPGGVPAAGVFTALGPPDQLGLLMAELSALGERPARLTVETTSYDDVPAPWRHREHHSWHWMLTRTPPPTPAADIEEILDATEVDAVLDVANPGSFARPGTPGVECWLGIRDRGLVVAVGALVRQPDGSGHLRGVSVLPTHAGRGLGTALSAALTGRGLAGASSVCTLGAYVDNQPAVSIYRRLGYGIAHTFSSGAVSA